MKGRKKNKKGIIGERRRIEKINKMEMGENELNNDATHSLVPTMLPT